MMSIHNMNAHAVLLQSISHMAIAVIGRIMVESSAHIELAGVLNHAANCQLTCHDPADLHGSVVLISGCQLLLHQGHLLLYAANVVCLSRYVELQSLDGFLCSKKVLITLLRL